MVFKSNNEELIETLWNVNEEIEAFKELVTY